MGKGIHFLLEITKGTFSFEIFHLFCTFTTQYFQIRTFIVFRMWKNFYVWKKIVSYKKFVAAKHYLKENLFISDSILSKALLEIESMCSIFLDSSLFDNSIFEKILLFYFVEKQVNICCIQKEKNLVHWDGILLQTILIGSILMYLYPHSKCHATLSRIFDVTFSYSLQS